MKRNIDINEISDGQLYGPNDMVKADCKGCEGCSDCCKGMGESIVLDPYDIYRLTTGLQRTFEELLTDKIACAVAHCRQKGIGDERSSQNLPAQGEAGDIQQKAGDGRGDAQPVFQQKGRSQHTAFGDIRYGVNIVNAEGLKAGG